MHARLEQNIALGGTALANTLDQLILDNHNLGSLFDENERRDIIAAGVNTVGDLTTTDEQGRVTWTQTNRLPTPCLDKVTQQLRPSTRHNDSKGRPMLPPSTPGLRP